MTVELLYSFHPRADEQQTEIWIYTYQHWCEQQADTYIDELHEKITQVARDFSLLRDLPEGIDQDIKFFRYGRHYIFVKKSITTSPVKLQVLAILHDSMDIPVKLRAILD